MMATRNNRIYDTARVFICTMPEVLEKPAGERMDYAFKLAAMFDDKAKNLGFLDKQTNTKKDYYEAMTENQRSWFNTFWDAYDHKKHSSKKHAIKSFYDVVNHKDFNEKTYELIVYGAQNEARYRKDTIARGGIPKHAQGWLSGSRFEGYELPAAKAKQAAKISPEVRELKQEIAHFKAQSGKWAEGEVKRLEEKLKNIK